ncbi:hypothetical protein [Verminephrobacter eiseniae]|uniref:hypothetical protein n=1 Tax=Verminephrobacter eiseniae TaxID=364317 RepID=UPI002237B8D2|nr:hypothetical protein [Verminephrobacter eiseniae]
MSAARPSEGAHTAAAGEGTPVRAARPPEGAHTVAESEGAPVSAGQRHAARIHAHALRIHACGGIGQLRCAAIEAAPPASGEVQIRPHAIGINCLDTCRRQRPVAAAGAARSAWRGRRGQGRGAGQDHHQAIEAFPGKRRPNFTGRWAALAQARRVFAAVPG